ncbi:MAG: DUF1501 domain-containing protein [Myxococcales bacterium]|nr:DUF1501 domain-containing protein [Myxococcales bacterium]
MNRRRFLAGSGLAMAGLGLPRRGLAATGWGEAPTDGVRGLLPAAGERTEKLLDIHCYGGLSYYDSVYVVEELGRAAGTGWHLLAHDHDRFYGEICGLPREDWLTYWADDAEGFPVKLGPAARALALRPDVLARTRAVVMAHDQLPHVAAVPLTMTGKALGNPRLAGFGTHVQRYFRERDASTVPRSFHLLPSDYYEGDNLQVGDAGGAHPASARPLTLSVRPDSPLPSLLRREVLGQRREAMDALTAHYVEQTRLRYQHPEVGVLRSAGLDEHGFAVSSLRSGPRIAQLLGDRFMPTQGTSQCGVSAGVHRPTMGIDTAVALLQHPSDPGRCCTVVDNGLSLNGSYDSHFGDHIDTQTQSLGALLGALLARVNEPEEADPDKLDLDETMVAITTEFGRTPTLEYGAPNSTGHNPQGYVVLLMGGAIRSEHAGFSGHISELGVGSGVTHPSELRAAMLASFGIHPFEDESFRVSDVAGARDEAEAVATLMTRVLGRSA